MTEKISACVASNMKLSMGLWPNAMWTPELQSLWREQFSRIKDQDMLEESIKWIKPLFASHQPEIKWVIQQYARFYEAKHPKYEASVERQSRIFHVAWMQPSRLDPSRLVEYGTVCHSLQDAQAVAQQRGGRVIQNESNTPVPTEMDYLAEEDQAKAAISNMTRPELLLIIEKIRSYGWLKDKLPGKYELWNRTTLLMVFGGLLYERSKHERV